MIEGERSICANATPTIEALFGGLTALWRKTTGDQRICIAVLDGPVDLTHNCFRGARLNVINQFFTSKSLTVEAARHGTHVSSILFGQHDSQLFGVAPGCNGLIIPIYQVSAAGRIAPCPQETLAAAIVTAVNAGASVINVSGGELATNRGVAPQLFDAISLCREKDVLIVGAAGNDGCDGCVHIPAALPTVLAVGGMDQRGRPMPDSNWGRIYSTQAVLTLGEDVPVAEPFGGITTASGTSFAAPIVSGIAGLLLSLQRAMNRSPTPSAVREALLATAQGCLPTQLSEECKRLLAGRIDIRAASLYLLNSPGESILRNGNKSHFTSSVPPASPDKSGEPDGLHPSCDFEDTTEPVSGDSEETDLRGVDDDEFAEGAFSPSTRRSSSTHGTPRGIGSHNPGSQSRLPPVSQRRNAMSRSMITPSGCGCQSRKGEYVYVIGTQIGYDFGTRTRQMSIQDNFFSGLLPPAQASVQTPDNFLRYLLGWAFEGPDARRNIGGNLYDIEAVHWVLYQEGCPVYAIRPQGPFAAAAYKELLHFYIDNHSIILSDFGVRYDCMQDYFNCHGGTSDPLLGATPGGTEPGVDAASPPVDAGEQKSENSPRDSAEGAMDEIDPEEAVALIFQERPNRAARIAIAGEITGEVQLSTGEVVEIINPAMRGTSSWNTARLVSLAKQVIGDDGAALMVVAKLVSRLYDEARNNGKSPEDRALNWAATTLLRSIRPLLGLPVPGSRSGTLRPNENNIFQMFIGGLRDAAVDSITVKPSTCRQTGMEFDVEVSLFNFENVQRGVMVLEQTIDVSDVVPVTMGMIRPFTRR